MAVQDPSLTRAELAFERTAMIDARPAVSWGAIFAGAFAAAALSFILLSIGAAFGLSVTSPWDITARNAGEAAAAVGIGTAIWLVIVHAVSSGLGGYLAGRLRTKLVGVRGDETYFRDTAHGLVVWAVSAVMAVLLVGYVAMAAARGTADVGAAALNATGEAAGGALAAATPAVADQASSGGIDVRYFVDSLFRPGGAPATNTGQATGQPATGQPATGQTATQPTAQPNAPGPAAEANARMDREETGRILRMALAGDISADDRTFVTQLVARETGMPQAQAEQRVNQVIDRAKAAKAQAVQKAKEGADVARKAGMYTALWAAITMLIGAFCASLAATWGGRARDL